jgi:hypothetical protein
MGWNLELICQLPGEHKSGLWMLYDDKVLHLAFCLREFLTKHNIQPFFTILVLTTKFSTYFFLLCFSTVKYPKDKFQEIPENIQNVTLELNSSIKEESQISINSRTVTIIV